jgi:DGQHR domain-containing protein
MYFLGIRKSDLEKTGPSKTFKPAKSRPYKVTRVPLEGDKMIMYSLSIRVEDIINYVTVLRMAQKYDKKGFQRMIKSNRLDKINKEYLEKNETFPNNIILFLNPELYQNEEDFYTPAKDSPYKKDNPGNGELTFFDEYNSLIIIDGQHRFFSFVTGNKTERPILVTLIFLKGEDEAEKFVQMEKMFYKINKTQERVDPNLSFILKARIDPESEENFWYEVFRKLDTKGFFSKRFSFKETTMKKDDQKKSIISVITYGGILRLNKTFKKKGIEVDGLSTFYGTDRIKNIEFSFNLLNNYFDIIEKVLHEQNIKKENLTPREIGALLRLMRHFMLNDKNKLEKLGRVRDIRKEQDKESKDTVEYFEGILKCIPFSEVLELNYPTSNWAAIEGYMLKKIHAKKPKFGNKVLLSKKGLEVYIHETKQN